MSKYSVLTIPALCVLMACNTATAATYGKGSEYDSRIQRVVYNENDVVNVRVKMGAVTGVQVSKDEVIKDVGLGDPAAWTVSVRDHTIFFRPAVADDPNTNVLITTDKNTYSLFLTAVNSNPTYILRYDYPKKPSTTLLTEKKPPCTDGGVINGHYQLKGDKSIFPYQIWDDGAFTCMRWTPKQSMPVVYSIDADGNENLVNGNPDNNTMVYYDVSDKFVLRLGNQVVDVRTSSIVNKGWNKKATTNGKTRIEKFNYEK